MTKQPISVTLEQQNLLWLRGQVKRLGARSVSEVLDRILATTRAEQRVSGESLRSVVGSVEIDEADPGLTRATAELRTEVEVALQQGLKGKRRTSRG